MGVFGDLLEVVQAGEVEVDGLIELLPGVREGLVPEELKQVCEVVAAVVDDPLDVLVEDKSWVRGGLPDEMSPSANRAREIPWAGSCWKGTPACCSNTIDSGSTFSSSSLNARLNW